MLLIFAVNILYKIFGAAISLMEFTSYTTHLILLIGIKQYIQLKYAYTLLFSYKICLGFFLKGSFGIINDFCLLSVRPK